MKGLGGYGFGAGLYHAALRASKFLASAVGRTFTRREVFYAPRLGAATFISLTIAGQMLVSILLDQFGLVGFATRPATPLRLLGALLLVAGVLLIRKS